MRGLYKKPTYLLFQHNEKRCILLSNPNAREGMYHLGKWFIDGERVPLEAARRVHCAGEVWDSRSGWAVKHQPRMQAMHEFLVALRAEELTEVTPREPVLLVFGKEGYLSTRMIDGLPLSLLAHEGMPDADAARLSSGALLALGLLHYGNGKFGVLHGDMCVNNLLSPGAGQAGDAARVMFVDLAAARVVRHGGNFGEFAAEIGELAFNLFMCGLLREAAAKGALEHYLGANPLADRRMAADAMEQNISMFMGGRDAET